jgi:hypothetical protein
MNHISKVIILCWLCVVALASSAQTFVKSPQLFLKFKNYDLSKLWCDNKLRLIDGDVKSVDFPEPLGFIGNDYERFYIHYTSVKKDLSSPYKYLVTGKTRVKNSICSFTGTITVVKVESYESHQEGYSVGFITCKVNLKEDVKEPESGFIKGILSTDFCIDKKSKVYYNTIDAVADGFSNNQCEATWTSYKTHRIKKCNWGDYRIPNSGDLDEGTGEFIVREKYKKNGWLNYANMYNRNKKFLKEENRKWWL